MAKYLGKDDQAFRALVTELDGEQRAIADVMRISASAVSHRLLTERHGQWWLGFKARRARRRQAERQRRYRERHRELGW